MLGHTLIGIVDNIMVGKLGAAELAAVSLGNSFIFIAISLGIGFSTAITPIVAQADAEGDSSKIRAAFHHGLFLCAILGITLFGLVVLAKPLMYFMGQPEEVIVLAKPYIDWVAFSLIPVVVYQGYKQFADGLSMTKYSMYAIIMANVVHVLLNYLLIYGIWIFPKMGIVGAALGTVISRLMMVVFMHLILSSNKKLAAYFQNFSFQQIKKAMLQKIINIGLPSALQMFFEVALFTAAIWLSGSLGKNSQAANQIALSLASATFMFAMGLSVTAMIRVSNQKGLKDYRKLVVVARSIFLLAIIIEIVFALFFVLFHQYLPHLFLNMENNTLILDNEEVITIAAKLLLVAAVFQISDGIQVVVLGALRGLQDVKVPMYITFAAYWVVGFPISYYLGKHTDLKATGIWIGLLAGLTVAAVFLYIRFNYLTKKLITNNRVSDSNSEIENPKS
jgi:multidrug resistance protein, MATE family